WIFAQTRDRLAGRPVRPATRADVRGYVERLYRELGPLRGGAGDQVARIKKYLNFVGQGVDPDGAFLHAMRRTRTEAELLGVCDAFLLADPGAPVPLEAFPGVHARPNSEAPVEARRSRGR
ncbi:dihydrouridine synthase, partial [bacterium]